MNGELTDASSLVLQLIAGATDAVCPFTAVADTDVGTAQPIAVR